MSSAAIIRQGQYPTGFKRFIIVLSAVLQLVDTTIVNVALRQISGSIGATTTEIAWIITSYAISNVVIIPLSGMLSNLFGRKVYFTVSIALFTLASLMCGLSGSLWELVFWRFIQGIGGGALMTTSQTIIVEAFPPNKAAAGMAIFGMSIACGPALGPLLGGYLTDTYSWHWIFLINVPLGIMATLLSWLYIADQKERRRKNRLDWLGIALLTVGIGSLQFVLEEGNLYDWFQSNMIIAFSILAAAGIIFFIIWELRITDPAVKLSLFKIPNIALGAILNFVIGAVLFGTMYSYPLFAQISLGWTSTLTGLSLTPGAIMTAVTISVVQISLRKGVNPKYLVFIGFTITIIFCLQMYFQSPDSNWDSLFVPMLLRGFGMGFLMLPILLISIKGLEGYDLEQGTGISNMARQLGGAFGLALLSNRITRSSALFRNELVPDINTIDLIPSSAVQNITQSFAANGYPVHEAQAMAYKVMDFSVMKQTAILSYLDSFMIVGLACCAVLPLLLFMKSNSKSLK